MSDYSNFQVQIIRNMDEDMHLHPEVELLYVMDGELEVTVHEKEYRLKRNDVILINSSLRHAAVSGGKNILCRVAYDYQVITDMVRHANSIFLCNSVIDQEKSYEQLRELFQELVYLEVLYPHKSESYRYSLLYRLLDQLIENFMMERPAGQLHSKEYQDDGKLQEIIRYVYQNFQEVVSLSALADQMYLSKSTLSRFFKKQTGVYFAEYVNQIRLNYAVRELLYSERNITKIAMNCGFSTTSVFDKTFRENFGMPPTEYRNTMQETVKKEQQYQETVCEQLREELKEQAEIPQEITTDSQKVVDVTAGSTQVLEKNWNKVINIGSVYSLTLANVQYHLLYLAKELGFTYARVWTIFDRRLMICDGSSVGNYNYDVLDSVLDFLVSHQLIPYLDFSKRPSTAIRSAGDVVYYREEGIDFLSKKAWEVLFEDFACHVVRRYGKKEVSRWIFEVSRDPTHEKEGKYYEDPDYHIFHVYQFVYRTVKRLVPQARVGGFGGLADTDAGLFREFLELGKVNDCVPNFVSFILFPYSKRENEEERPYTRSPERDFETRQIRLMRQHLQRTGLESCSLYATEWNNTVSNRNFLNDSCFRGTYLCKKVSEIRNAVDLLCIWMGSDWVSNYYDSFSIVNGGSGLLTKDGIPKPAFYALEFLNRLGNQLVMTGDHFIITKSQSGNYRILCFNFNWYSIQYFLKAESTILPQDLGTVFHENETLTLNLVFHDMEEDAVYVVKKRSISQEKGSILDEWGKFQYETHLERTDVKYLQEICIPHLGMEKIRAEQSRLHLHLKLGKHEFSLFHIYKDKR